MQALPKLARQRFTEAPTLVGGIAFFANELTLGAKAQSCTVCKMAWVHVVADTPSASKESAARRDETADLREQQAATAEILRLITTSP